MTIKLIGKDRTSEILYILQGLFVRTVYPYLPNVNDVKAIRDHIEVLNSWPGFDCSVQIGTVPELQKTTIIIDITPLAQTPDVKQ